MTTSCPDCGAEMEGLPWERRECPACHIWMPPNIFHPDAPEEVQERGRIAARNFIRARVEEHRNGKINIRAERRKPNYE